MTVGLVGLPLTAYAEFCGVRLSVTLPDHSPVILASADLIDARGMIVQTAQVRDGEAEFCDFGFGHYSIRVYNDSSLPVVLSGIRLKYGRTQTLLVMLNPIDGVGTGVGSGNACRAYIRVFSRNMSPITGARVSLGSARYTSDSFGRVLVLIPLRRFVSVRFEKSAFQPREISLGCADPTDLIERTVVLFRHAHN